MMDQLALGSVLELNFDESCETRADFILEKYLFANPFVEMA